MPVYTYLCDYCEVAEDITHPMNHDHPVVCMMGHFMTKQFAAVPTIFKGSGFYKTDKE